MDGRRVGLDRLAARVRDCCLGDLTSPSREKEPTDGQKPVQPGHKHKGKGKGKINLVPCLDQQLRETKPRDGVSQ